MYKGDRQNYKNKVYNTLTNYSYVLVNAYKNAISFLISFSILELNFGRRTNKGIFFLRNLSLKRSLFALYFDDVSILEVFFVKIKLKNLKLLYLSNILKTICLLIAFILVYFFIKNDDQIKLVVTSLLIFYIYSVFFFEHEL